MDAQQCDHQDPQRDQAGLPTVSARPRNSGCAGRFHGLPEPVTAARESFDEARRLDGVAERLTQPFHRGVDAVLEVDDRVARPKLLAQVFTRHELARPLDEHAQNPQRLPFKLDLHPAPAQLQCAPVEFEGVEPKELRSRVIRVSHEPRSPTPAYHLHFASVSPSVHCLRGCRRA